MLIVIGISSLVVVDQRVDSIFFSEVLNVSVQQSLALLEGEVSGIRNRILFTSILPTLSTRRVLHFFMI